MAESERSRFDRVIYDDPDLVTPQDAVYYYECGAGSFRLVYFIPPAELECLQKEGRFSVEILDVFPDGVDLDCTEPDFNEFEELSGYRPKHSPDALRRAFFAIYSSTSNWKRFQGTGFIAAEDLERHMVEVEKKLSDRELAPEEVEPMPETATFEARRERTNRRAAKLSQMRDALEELPLEGVEPQKSLRQQRFSEIRWSKGKTAEEVFSRVHQKSKR